MKSKTIVAIVSCVLGAPLVLGQAAAQQTSAGQTPGGQREMAQAGQRPAAPAGQAPAEQGGRRGQGGQGGRGANAPTTVTQAAQSTAPRTREAVVATIPGVVA